MKQQQSNAELLLQLGDMFAQFIESASGVRAKAIENGFNETEAAQMAVASYSFTLGMVLKSQT